MRLSRIAPEHELDRFENCRPPLRRQVEHRADGRPLIVRESREFGLDPGRFGVSWWGIWWGLDVTRRNSTLSPTFRIPAADF